MNWLNKIVEQIIADHPEGEVVVSSGVSPSGAYHLGTLREVMTAEVIARELRARGRESRHIHVSDDLDVFRKVPADVSSNFDQYLGMPLCDVPSPDPDKAESYADYFVADLLPAAKGLNMDMEVVRAHEKYRSGYFVDAIEKVADNIEPIRAALQSVSGRKLDPQWSPIQVIENGRVKNRQFVSINIDQKTLVYVNNNGEESETRYDNGNVTLSWRIDWPARWWKLGVDVEPFGRDHATKGGSYDTGVAIVRDVFGVEPPMPVPYDFINKAGQTKKMSKSAGDAVTAAELLRNIPAEVVWFFMLRSAPNKQLFFDTHETLIKIFDEFGELLSKSDKSEDEEHLLRLCLHGVEQQTISRVPFTHLYVSYQASLRDVEKTLDVIRRTEYTGIVDEDEEIIRTELQFIDSWLDTWAPDDVRFELQNGPADSSHFSEEQVVFLKGLAEKIKFAPEDADGEWFHKAIYEFKEELGLQPKELFTTLYKILINKDSGPRAGWFLSTLPREWLIERLSLD